MKHLQPFVNGAKKTTKIDPIGFICYFRNYLYCGAFPSFHDFALALICDITGRDEEDLEMSDELIGDAMALTDTVGNNMSDYLDETMSDEIANITVWWGATPKSPLTSAGIKLISLPLTNPYRASKELDELFTNARECMDSVIGNMNHPGFIGLSIANVPSQLDLYLNTGLSDFSKDEVIQAVKAIKNPSPELAALIKYHLNLKDFI